jgi:hypothetical protein
MTNEFDIETINKEIFDGQSILYYDIINNLDNILEKRHVRFSSNYMEIPFEDLRQLVVSTCIMIFEVIKDIRNINQLENIVTDQVYEYISKVRLRNLKKRNKEQEKLFPVSYYSGMCQINSQNWIEVQVIVNDNKTLRPVALSYEKIDKRWKFTAIELGNI